MMFDWQRFLDRHSIPYVERGPNIGRNEIGVKCPFCGPADKSEHMAISLLGRGWICRRESQRHKGRHPARLVAALLGCSYQRAKELVGDPLELVETGSISGVVEKQFTDDVPDQEPDDRTLSLPKEFRTLCLSVSARPFLNYLLSRGYTDRQIFGPMTKRYGIKYCCKGVWKGRIIFPVYHDGKLVSWTGRTIYRSQSLRYKSLTADPEAARTDGTDVALGPISNFLLWRDFLLETGRNILVICEGPFDALRLNLIGRRYGVAATCLFTNSPSEAQFQELMDIAPRFDRCFLLLDQSMWNRCREVARQFTSYCTVQPLRMPDNVADPGEMTAEDLRRLLSMQGIG